MKVIRSSLILIVICISSALWAASANRLRTSLGQSEEEENEDENETLDEEEKEEGTEKIMAELQESNERQNELNNTLAEANELADDAELEEEHAEAAIVKKSLETEKEEEENHSDPQLKQLMGDLVKAVYRLHDVNKKLKLLD